MSGQPADKSGSGRLAAAVWTARESGSGQSDTKLRPGGSAAGTGAGESDAEPEPGQSGDWKPRTDSFHSHAKLWLQRYGAASWRCSDAAQLSGNISGDLSLVFCHISVQQEPAEICVICL